MRFDPTADLVVGLNIWNVCRAGGYLYGTEAVTAEPRFRRSGMD